MTRVEDEAYARAQAEAEKAQKRIDRDTRDKKATEAGRDAFAKLVKGQQAAQETKRGGSEKAGQETKQQEKAGEQSQRVQSEAEKRAAMARASLTQNSRQMEQAKTFQGTLQKVHGESQQQNTQLVERRDTGTKKARVEGEDRKGEVVQKAENKRDREQDVARVEQFEAKRANAAIDTNKKGDSGGGGTDKRGDDGSAAAIARAKQQPAPAPAAEAKAAAHEVKQIPPELLEKLVSTVHLAVNQRGMKEFQIELKEGVLSGATLKISAEDGKVALKFMGLDAHKKNLIESSKGDLMRKLEGKGLRLARLEVG
jgi:hypothetical protein